MNKTFLASVAAFGMLLMLPSKGQAHHSFAAEYDSNSVITLTGVVTKVDWTNPHIYIHLDVKDASGKVTSWSLEGYPPNTLKRTGFARDSLKEGQTVTITAYKPKNGSQPVETAKRGVLPRTFPCRKARKAALSMILQRPA
jgi:hypothetical protein